MYIVLAILGLSLGIILGILFVNIGHLFSNPFLGFLFGWGVVLVTLSLINLSKI